MNKRLMIDILHSIINCLEEEGELEERELQIVKDLIFTHIIALSSGED